MDDKPLNALIYARESEFVAKDGTRSTSEQVDESLARCASKSWTPITVDGKQALVDDGKGASRYSKGKRSQWERACRIIAGEEPGVPQPGVLVVWAASRAQRDLSAYVDLRDLCTEHGVLYDYNGATYDLSDVDDRFRTGLDALLAERDAGEIHKNVVRAMRANFAGGRPHGRVPFGYRRIYDPVTKAFVRQEPHPETAPVVQRIYREYLEGCGIQGIASRLNEDKLPARTGPGSHWTYDAVAAVLDNATYKGTRTRRGEETDGVWEPIIDPDTWDRTAARRQARRTSGSRQAPSVRLLTGVARCGACMAAGTAPGRMTVLGVGPKRANGLRDRYYRCRDCCSVFRKMDHLDAWVEAHLLAKFARSGMAELVPDTEDPAVTAARQRAESLKAELDEAMQLWKQRDENGNRRLSAQAYADMEADLLPQIAAAEREATSNVLPLSVNIPEAERLEQWWFEELTPELRREVVAAFVLQVVVHRSGRGRRRYDLGAVTEIVWRR